MKKQVTYFYSLYIISSFLFSQSAFSQAAQADSLLKLATAIYNSMPDSSMHYCEEAKSISTKNNLQTQYGYSLICEVRYTLLKGDFKTSLQKINEAAKIFEDAKNNSGLAKCYSLKSIAMGRLDNQKEHLTYQLKSLELYTLAHDTDGICSASVNLANVYKDNGEYEKALTVLDNLKKLHQPVSTNNFYIELNYGTIYLNQKKYTPAINHLQNAVKFARTYKMMDSEITALTHLAECFKQTNLNTEAINFFNEALSLAIKNKFALEERDALKSLITLLEKEKKLPEAFAALKRFNFLQDSLLNLEKIKSIQKIESELKLTEKEKIIAEQNLALEKEQLEKQTGKLQRILLTGGLVILIVALIFLYYHFKRTGRLFALIKVQKKEVEFQKELIEAKNKEVTDSINYARYIQSGMLPSEKNIKNLFPDHFIFYKPKDIVAGDFYWVESTSNNQSLFAVCDCTGHGVPGAMVSIVACNALTRAVKEFKLTNPALIFDKVNLLMQETFSKSEYDIKDGMDGVLCSFDASTMQLQVAAANNPLWIIGPVQFGMEKDSHMELMQISADKQPVGKHGEESQPFTVKNVTLAKGEMLYLFTDGFADQFGGEKGKKYKYKQLQELLLQIAHLPMEAQKIKLHTTFEEWRGNLEQVDDVLVVGIRV